MRRCILILSGGGQPFLVSHPPFAPLPSLFACACAMRSSNIELLHHLVQHLVDGAR